MDIHKLVQVSGEIAKDKGWHDKGTTFGDRLALIHSEVSEVLEAFREYGMIEKTWQREDGKPEGVVYELADIIIRVADLSYYYGLDLHTAINKKLDFNSTRPHRHGGKFL